VASAISLVSGSGWNVPHIGASGAIAAVMGAYVVLCPHKSFYLWFVRIGLYGNMFTVSAWLYLFFWFAMQIMSLRFGNPGIDYWAHIGGFLFGYIVGKVVRVCQWFDPQTGEWRWGQRRSQARERT
jgi:membrane associated rhomboid family serine protease